ncbi:MAG: transglycosylase SLT domain-containing protein [Bacteroidota bacterium]
METEPSPSSSKQLVFSCLLVLFSLNIFAANTSSLDKQVDHVMEVTEEVVKERLGLLDESMIEHRFDDAVRRLISYHLRYPKQTARNLGRAIAYFPIFEKELAAAGLPETIKYLPVIESALRPYAMSRVGAEGLWQFMPETAPEYGLLVDDLVDERLDTYAATQGAIRYLQSAYDYLGDWSLAIAAYNAGKGRVRRAQRRSGGKNFWRVRRYLPRETRKYVPAFIAAVYLCEFFAAHEIEPLYPSMDEQLLERMVITTPLSFYRIAQITELPIDMIQRLNPGYIQGYLPAYPGGHNLILPQRVVPAMKEYLQQYGNLEDEPVLPWAPIFNLNQEQDHEEAYQQYSLLVMDGDSLESVAARTEYSPSQLAIWNQLSPLDSLVEGRELMFYRPIQFHKMPERDLRVSEFQLTSTLFEIVSLDNEILCLPHPVQPIACQRIAKRQSVDTFLQQYPQVNKQTFLHINEWPEKRALPSGKIVLLPI